MEEESSQQTISDSEFLDLLPKAKHGDSEALLNLIRYFEKDISHLSRFIRLPKEDAKQSIITELIEFLKKNI
jgi:Helix-turn-helix domain